MFTATELEYFKEEFNHQTIEKVIKDYDGPKVYTFNTTNGAYYLAYFCDDSEDFSSTKWFYFPTNNSLVEKLIFNRVTIREFMKNCLSAFIVDVTGNNISNISYTPYFNQLPADFIPQAGVMLTNSQSKLTLKVERAGISPSNINEKSLVWLLDNFRTATKSAMKKVKSIFPEKFSEYTTFPELAVPSITPGSVEINLTPLAYNPLMNETFKILEATFGGHDYEGVSAEDAKELQYYYYSLAPSKRSTLFNFDTVNILGEVKDLDSRSPVSITFTPEDRKHFIEIKKTRDKEKALGLFVGKIRGLHLDQDYFFLGDLEANNYQLREIKCFFDTEDSSIEIEQLLVENTEIPEDADFKSLIHFLCGQTTVLQVSGEYDMNKKELQVISIKPLATRN